MWKLYKSLSRHGGHLHFSITKTNDTLVRLELLFSREIKSSEAFCKTITLLQNIRHCKTWDSKVWLYSLCLRFRNQLQSVSVSAKWNVNLNKAISRLLWCCEKQMGSKQKDLFKQAFDWKTLLISESCIPSVFFIASRFWNWIQTDHWWIDWCFARLISVHFIVHKMLPKSEIMDYPLS